MKTNTIILALHGDEKNVNRLSGHWKSDFDTKQYATYWVENGLATITELKPVFGTVLNVPLPFVLPVNDLGSGILKQLDINADTLQPYPAVCPSKQWVSNRMRQPALTTPQILLADYIGLL